MAFVVALCMQQVADLVRQEPGPAVHYVAPGLAAPALEAVPADAPPPAEAIQPPRTEQPAVHFARAHPRGLPPAAIRSRRPAAVVLQQPRSRRQHRGRPQPARARKSVQA